MPRSRGSELPLRQSPRAQLQTRASSSESDPLHRRPIVDRSPKVGDRRSPRGIQSEPLNQKKLGTRVADLETQLGQAQEELKKLKDQLSYVEASKREAQEELEKKNTQNLSIQDTSKEALKEETNPSIPLPNIEIREYNEKKSLKPIEYTEENSKETDVFEVPQAPLPVLPNEEERETMEKEKCSASIKLEPKMPTLNENYSIHVELDLMKEKLEEKEKEAEVLREENKSLKGLLEVARGEAESTRAKEEETSQKLSQMGMELEKSKVNEGVLKEKMENVEREKVELESEMKKIRVQTEQWRKAADAAAQVLGGGMEMNGRRVGGERSVSMDKHLESSGYVGSPITDDFDDGFGSGRRKGSSIRMFGDLWKRKSQK